MSRRPAAQQEEEGKQEAAQQNDDDAQIFMEEIIEKLKMLDYENLYCKTKGFKPLPHTFFSISSASTGEQFTYFIALVSWLLSLNNHQVVGWNKYDDPNTASSNVVLELKKLGIEIDYPAAKLKTGCGEAVCAVLLALINRTFKQKRLGFEKPNIKEDDGEENEDLDDSKDDNNEIGDMAGEVSEDDDNYVDMIGDMQKGPEDDAANNQAIESNINPEEWYMECERVANKLRINMQADSREWRAHLEKTKQYSENVKTSLPDVRSKLEKTSDELDKALERISKKEVMLNKSFQNMTGDYRAYNDKLKEITVTYNTLNTTVQEYEQQLYTVNDKLESIQSKMDKQGKTMTDTSPLVNIKKAIAQVKSDIKNLELRIGVVSNTLMQATLKERGRSDVDIDYDVGGNLDELE